MSKTKLTKEQKDAIIEKLSFSDGLTQEIANKVLSERLIPQQVKAVESAIKVDTSKIETTIQGRINSMNKNLNIGGPTIVIWAQIGILAKEAEKQKNQAQGLSQSQEPQPKDQEPQPKDKSKPKFPPSIKAAANKIKANLKKVPASAKKASAAVKKVFKGKGGGIAKAL